MHRSLCASGLLRKAFSTLAFGITMFSLAGPASASPLVFGPKTYTISAGKPQTFSETVLLDPSLNCDAKSAFILVVQNGDGNGSNAISSGSVTFNGATAVGEKDFKPGQAPIERPVTLGASNSLGVELKGGHPGNTVTLSIRREIEEPVEGPKDYPLTSNSQHFADSFSIPDPTAVFTVVVRNGDANGLHRMKSGSISVNGTTVVSTSDLAGDWPLIRKRVGLQTTNSLAIDLKGTAGDVVNVSIKRLLDESACGGPRIFIDSPASGQTITSGKIVVTGTATGLSDLGIQVNGFVAQTDRSHAGTPSDPFRWVALVAAEAGSVTLTAKVTDGQRRSASAVRSIIYAPAPEPLSLTAPTSIGVVGIAPFSCLFQLSASNPAAIQSYSIDFNGDGVADASGTALPEELSFVYSNAGLYAATLQATDSNGAVHSATAYIVVESFVTIHRIIAGRLTQLQTAFTRQDVEGAVALFAGAEAQQKYRAVFTALFDRLPAIGASMERPAAISVNGDTADYLVGRTENGRFKGYHMSLIRDADGVWRIADF